MVAAARQQARNLSVDRGESLQLTCRFEPAHDLLADVIGLVRILGSVVQPLVLPMLDAQTQGDVCRRVAAKLVGYHHARVAVAPEQLAHWTLGRGSVALALHQDVEHCAVLVPGTLAPVLQAADHDHHFVEAPFVAAGRCR